MELVIAINPAIRNIINASEAGYIGSTELREKTGISIRRLDYWRSQGVFGDSHMVVGSGHRLMWHISIIPSIKILNEIALKIDETNYIPVDLLRKVFENFEQGYVQVSENVRLEWRNHGQHQR